MCEDLQSEFMPLFVRTPNHKNNFGTKRECWIPSPSAISPLYLRMYIFLGGFLGFAIRQGESLAFDFPPLFWKLILKHKVSVDDLKDVDEYAH
jgi:E3 ubiquitin-protein ligase HERC2